MSIEWKPGDKALIVPEYMPCEIATVYSEEHVSVWVPDEKYAADWRVVSTANLRLGADDSR